MNGKEITFLRHGRSRADNERRFEGGIIHAAMRGIVGAEPPWE